jgi:hypothetical protein
MTRLLLAFLALLGLAVQAAPAEAATNCSVGSAEIGALTVTRSQARSVISQAEHFVPPVTRQAKLIEVRPAARLRSNAGPVPAVLTGIDRARE